MTSLTRNIWILWAGLLGAIIVGSLLPNFGPSTEYDFDKFIHMGAYLTLAFLPALVLQKVRNALVILMGLALISGVIELLQAHIPGRGESIYDFGANVTGAAIGIFIGRLIRHQCVSRKSDSALAGDIHKP